MCGFTDKNIGLVHVLTDDVLESIPILMETQKKEPESYAEKLADLEKKWRVEDQNMTRSMKVERFKTMMNDFEVDKPQIVIGPDVRSYFSSMRTVYYGTGAITTYNRDGNLIITAHQAVFHVFQSTIFGYNWHELKKNPHNRKKFEEFYKFFLEITKEYRNMENGLLVTLSLVEKDIKTLNHKIFTKKWVRKVCPYTYENAKYYEEISIEPFSDQCANLRIYCESIWNKIPVHKARAYFLYGYTNMFFPNDVVKQKMMLVDG